MFPSTLFAIKSHFTENDNLNDKNYAAGTSADILDFRE